MPCKALTRFAYEQAALNVIDHRGKSPAKAAKDYQEQSQVGKSTPADQPDQATNHSSTFQAVSPGFWIMIRPSAWRYPPLPQPFFSRVCFGAVEQLARNEITGDTQVSQHAGDG